MAGRRHAGVLSRADPWSDVPPRGREAAARRSRIEEDAHATAALTETVPARDKAAALLALERSIGCYIDLRLADPPPATTSHMPEALRDYIAASASR
jgi:hypothetical protein